MSSNSNPSSTATSLLLREQWSNPSDIFTILLIIGGDVVQKAIGQLTAGPVPYFTPVSFSFGWVRRVVSTIDCLGTDTDMYPGHVRRFGNALSLRRQQIDAFAGG